jgi:hypothetical protein
MFGSKRLAAGLAALLLITSVVPATAIAADGSAEGSAETDAEAVVHVHVTQNATIMTVESDGEAASDATVTVEDAGKASYEGNGSYEANADGEVRLPAPESETTVHVSVESENVEGEGVVTLPAPDSGEYEATVELESSAEASMFASFEAFLPVEFSEYVRVDADNGSVGIYAGGDSESDGNATIDGAAMAISARNILRPLISTLPLNAHLPAMPPGPRSWRRASAPDRPGSPRESPAHRRRPAATPP